MILEIQEYLYPFKHTRIFIAFQTLNKNNGVVYERWANDVMFSLNILSLNSDWMLFKNVIPHPNLLFSFFFLYLACCPSNHFGKDCTPCPGGKERPCKGNGKCQVSLGISSFSIYLFFPFWSLQQFMFFFICLYLSYL